MKDKLEQGYTGDVPFIMSGLDDEKMKDIMKDYYTNISRASRSLNSTLSQKYQTGHGRIDEALAELSAVQNDPESIQDTSLQTSGYRMSLKIEENEHKRHASHD